MSRLLSREDFLLALYAAVAIVAVGLMVLDHVRTWRRRAAREALVIGHLRELRARVWADGAPCGGLEPEDGVLLARAVRAARAAADAENQARACVEALLAGEGGDGNEPARIADLAVAAEARLGAKLDRLLRVLPASAAAELEQAQVAWCDYRDRHVRLCRSLPVHTAEIWPIRHLTSEAVTAARIDDLEDLLAVRQLQR